LALALCATSCGSVYSGEHDTTFHFLVAPKSDGTFWGWTEIMVGIDVNSVGVANLWEVTLSIQPPQDQGADLSFLSNLKGEAVVGMTRTEVATLDSIPRGTKNAAMTVEYTGDLHPLFKDSSTIRIEWTGATNPAFTAWPQGGIWVQGDVVINVQ
jgi:hypothetical protein